MIYPTRNAVLLVAAGAPVALLLGLLAPGLWLAAVGWVIFAFGLVGLDALLSPSRRSLTVTHSVPGVIGAGASAQAVISLRFARRAPQSVELSLDADPRLGVAPARLQRRVVEAQAQAAFTLTPVRRGKVALDRLWARWRGPLGLAWKQQIVPLGHEVRITPDVGAVKQEAIRLFSRDALFGFKAQLDRGDGSEFESLREFQQGMDPRAIDWKRSATHRQLVAKEFRVERNHPMVFALDTGRLMCEPVKGLPRLDHALNAAMLLAYVALKAGDRVGLFAFDARPQLFTGAVSGVSAFPLLQRLAASIDYSAEETNFTLGLSQLASGLERRTLVVIFTDFADTTSAGLMIENAQRLIKRHLVLFVVMRDEELEDLAEAEPLEADDVSRAVIAGTLLRERDLVIVRLRRMGAHILDVAADRVGAELISRYLDLKRRDLL